MSNERSSSESEPSPGASGTTDTTGAPATPGTPGTPAAGQLPFRSRPFAGLLALVFGLLGAHRLYLAKRLWWVYPVIGLPALGWAVQQDDPIRSGGFFIATVVMLVAMLEAIVISLTPDEKWDARYNAGTGRSSANRWAPVLIAVVTLMIGATLMMSVLAIALEALFEAQRLR